MHEVSEDAHALRQLDRPDVTLERQNVVRRFAHRVGHVARTLQHLVQRPLVEHHCLQRRLAHFGRRVRLE